MNDLSMEPADPILERRVLRTKGEPPPRSFLTPLIEHPFEERKRRPPSQARPVVVAGIAYPSMRAACEAIGCSYDKIHGMIGDYSRKSGKEPRRKNGRSVIIAGVEYDSIAKAAVAHGKSYSWVYNRLGERKSGRRTK